MSAPKPDFYIGISTQNPPTIISIGRTIDGMEEIEVRLDQPDEDKLNVFNEKIDKIVAPVEESVVPVVEQPVVPVVEQSGSGKKTKRRRNKRRLTKRRKTKRSIK